MNDASTSQYLEIPLKRGGNTIWLACASQAIDQLILQRISTEQSPDHVIDLMVANPALLATIFYSTTEVDCGSDFVGRLLDSQSAIYQARGCRSAKPARGHKKLLQRIVAANTLDDIHVSLIRLFKKVTGKSLGELEVTFSDRNETLGADFVFRLAERADRWLTNNHSSEASTLARIEGWRRLSALHDNYQQVLLKEKLDSMRLLAYGASHEINNPLANISTRAQSLIQGEADPKRRHKLAVIYEQAMRAHEMITDMMLFAHPPKPRFESFDLSALIDEVLNEMAYAFERNQIKTTTLCENSFNVVADRTQIKSSLKSLLKNSIESIGCGGQIQVAAEALESGAINLAVSDSGDGIDDEIVRNIFDPFFSGREAGRGLGFGLSKAWRIAQLHDGTIEWKPCVKLGGVEFVFRIGNLVDRVSPRESIDKAA